jgi:hypothetical protein
MKKNLLFVLATSAMVLGLAACGGSSPTAPSPAPQPQPAPISLPACSDEITRDFNALYEAMIDPFTTDAERVAMAEECRKHTGQSIHCTLILADDSSQALDLDTEFANILTELEGRKPCANNFANRLGVFTSLVKFHKTSSGDQAERIISNMAKDFIEEHGHKCQETLADGTVIQRDVDALVADITK